MAKTFGGNIIFTFFERKVTKRTFLLAHYLTEYRVYPPRVKTFGGILYSLSLKEK